MLSGYYLILVSRIDPSENRIIHYTAKTNDENVSEHFLKTLDRLVYEIGKKYAVDKPVVITEKEQTEFDNATTCWICGQELGDDKVRDHCHFTGKYRGPAHNECNLLLRKDKTIPVGFHNGQNYNFHLFVKSLGRINGHIRTIAKNSEK